jgi:hypothetical protein
MGRHPRKDTIPDHPTWIEFDRSDGRCDSWPKITNREYKIDQAGNVDYLRIVPLDEPGRSIKWRRGIATALAELMKLPGTLVKLVRYQVLILFTQDVRHI